MSISILEQKLNETTEATWRDKVKSSEAEFYSGITAITGNGSNFGNFSLEKALLINLITSESVSTKISVSAIMKLLVMKYWETHKYSVLRRAQHNLLRDVKTIASIAKDYYGE